MCVGRRCEAVQCTPGTARCVDHVREPPCFAVSLTIKGSVTTTVHLGMRATLQETKALPQEAVPAHGSVPRMMTGDTLAHRSPVVTAIHAKWAAVPPQWRRGADGLWWPCPGPYRRPPDVRSGLARQHQGLPQRIHAAGLPVPMPDGVARMAACLGERQSSIDRAAHGLALLELGHQGVGEEACAGTVEAREATEDAVRRRPGVGPRRTDRLQSGATDPERRDAFRTHGDRACRTI